MATTSERVSAPGARFWLGDWPVEPSLNRISRGGDAVQVERQVMDLLVYLAGRAGEVVDKREIQDAVWQTEFRLLQHGRGESLRAARGARRSRPRAALSRDRPRPRLPAHRGVYKIRPERRDEIPAITHVDGTGRLQTVSQRLNPLYYRLIRSFGEKTGTPIVLNTSFNENEPVVNRPEAAIDCFQRTRMDTLVVGKAFLRKNA